MKARLSSVTGKSVISYYQREAIDKRVAELFNKRCHVFVERYMSAMCLALNDLYGFGDKRLGYVMRGLGDIIDDYARRSFTSNEARNGLLEDGETDPMAQAMQEELLSRHGLHINIKDYIK